MAKILIIDDDASICQTITHVVEHLGHKSVSSLTLKNASESIEQENFDVIFLDVRLPDGNGLEMLPQIRTSPSSPEVIMITGYGDPDGAELAIKNGAWDYIEKPFSLKTIILLMKRALDYREKKKAAERPIVLNRQQIIGNCPKLKNCLSQVAQAAQSDANVLISGESGTGKELIAAAIHENSKRAHRNFVVVDCAALPETLVESVLFGHEKGAFTGANKSQIGLIKQADEGTLFLDEVGELPLSIQKSFLRVLQEKRYRPVGSNREMTSNFRLISATNRDLDNQVESGKFREDVLFRLRAFHIETPPLRECREDIKDLVIHYTAQLCEHYNRDMKGFSPDFWETLKNYSWPGNVRELVQALERSIATANQEPILYPKHLPSHIRIQVAREAVQSDQKNDVDSVSEISPEPINKTLKEVRRAAIHNVEKGYLRSLLSQTDGDSQKAMSISGLSRSRFYTLLKKYDIFPKDF